MLEERGVDPDIGTLLYTKNTALDRNEESGNLAPAKEFSVGQGLLQFVVRERNALAAMEWRALNDRGERPTVPTGYEADAKCQYCFEQDTCMVVSGRLDQESKAGSVGTPVPNEERDYFDRFYVALEEERRETHAEYRKLWEQTPEERAADDRALIDLEPVSQTEIDDARWELRARKPGDAVSKLREGDVALASDGDPVTGHGELGRITALSEDEVVVETDEPVELGGGSTCTLRISVDRSLTALHDAILKGARRARTCCSAGASRSSGMLLTARRRPRGLHRQQRIPERGRLTRRRRRGRRTDPRAAGHREDVPIARTIRALVEEGNRVLLSAFTNRAVDNALEALRDQGFDEVLRVGSETGVRDDMQDVRLVQRGDPNAKAAELRDAPVVAATTAACGSRASSASASSTWPSSTRPSAHGAGHPRRDQPCGPVRPRRRPRTAPRSCARRTTSRPLSSSGSSRSTPTRASCSTASTG